MSRVCYLARPIDFVSGARTASGWQNSFWHVKQALTDKGWIVYSPAEAWEVSPRTIPGREIEEINRRVLDSSGLLVAFLPKGVPSVGVPMEIERACALAIPVGVLGPEESWALASGDAKVFQKKDALLAWLPNPGGDLDRNCLRFALGPGAVMPTRTYGGDAGWDLYSSKEVFVAAGEFADVPTGVRAALPPGTWARITGRSSTWRKWKLHVVDGVIDGGYRGELFSAVQNTTTIPVKIPAGTRLTQLILHRNLAPEHPVFNVGNAQFERIPSVDERGSSGFGSTGAGT